MHSLPFSTKMFYPWASLFGNISARLKENYRFFTISIFLNQPNFLKLMLYINYKISKPTLHYLTLRNNMTSVWSYKCSRDSVKHQITA